MNKVTNAEGLHVSPEEDVFMVEDTSPSYREPPTGIISCPRETHFIINGTYELFRPEYDVPTQGHRYSITRVERAYHIQVETPSAVPFSEHPLHVAPSGDFVPYKIYKNTNPYTRGLHYMTRLKALSLLLKENHILEATTAIRYSYLQQMALPCIKMDYWLALDGIYASACNELGCDLKVPADWIKP